MLCAGLFAGEAQNLRMLGVKSAAAVWLLPWVWSALRSEYNVSMHAMVIPLTFSVGCSIAWSALYKSPVFQLQSETCTFMVMMGTVHGAGEAQFLHRGEAFSPATGSDRAVWFWECSFSTWCFFMWWKYHLRGSCIDHLYHHTLEAWNAFKVHCIFQLLKWKFCVKIGYLRENMV